MQNSPALQSIAFQLMLRDLAVLRTLYRHRVATGPQLLELHFPSRSAGARRLKRLVRAGYLESWRPPRWGLRTARRYRLSRLAARAIAPPALQRQMARRTDFDRALTGWWISRRLAVVAVVLAIRRALAGVTGSRIRWVLPEISVRAGVRQRRWDMPDAVVGIEYRGTSQQLWLVLDDGHRSHRDRRRWLRRLIDVSGCEYKQPHILVVTREPDGTDSLRLPPPIRSARLHVGSYQQVIADPLGPVWCPPLKLGE